MYKLLFPLVLVALTTGCSMNAVQYQPDFDLINTMKDNNLSVMHVGDFSSQSPEVDKLSVRGTSMVSPFEKSYSEYLEEALKEQLLNANLYDDGSDIIITGELIENDVDAAGFSIGTARIAAKFKIQKAGKLVFDKTLKIIHKWDSSFMGAVAIPNAQNNYPIAVQKLINRLISDPDFIKSVKK